MSAAQVPMEDDAPSHEESPPAADGQHSSLASGSESSEASEALKLGTHANMLLSKQEQEGKNAACPLLEMASDVRSGGEATACNTKNNVAAPLQAGVALAAPIPAEDEDQDQVTNNGVASGGSQDVTGSGTIVAGEAPVVPSDPLVSRFVDGCARLGDVNNKRTDNLRMLNTIGRLFPEHSKIRSNATSIFNSYFPNQTASQLNEEVRNIVADVSTFSQTLQVRESRIADLMGQCNALSVDLQNFYAEGLTNRETSHLLGVDSVINVGGSPVAVDEDIHRVLTGDSQFAFLNQIFTSKLDTDDQGRVFLDMSVDVFKAMIAKCIPSKPKGATSRRLKKPKIECATPKEDSVGSVIASYYFDAVQNERPMCPMTIDQLIYNVLPGGDGGKFPVSLITPDDAILARLLKKLPALADPLTQMSLLFQGDSSSMDCSDFSDSLRGVKNTLLFVLDEGMNVYVMYNELPLSDESVICWSVNKGYIAGCGGGRNNFVIIRQESTGQKTEDQKVDGEDVSGNGDGGNQGDAVYFTMVPYFDDQASPSPDGSKVIQTPIVQTAFGDRPTAMPFNYGRCALQLRLGSRRFGANEAIPSIYQHFKKDPYWTSDAAEESGSSPDIDKRSSDLFPAKSRYDLVHMVAIQVNPPNEAYLDTPSARMHSILNKARGKIDVYVDHCSNLLDGEDDRKKGHDDAPDSLSMFKECPTLEQSKGLRSIKTKCVSLYQEQDNMLKAALEASLSRVRQCFMARHFSLSPRGKLVRITTHPDLNPIVTRLDTVAMFGDSKFSRQIFNPSKNLLEMTVTDSLDMDNHVQFQQKMSTELLSWSIKLDPVILKSVLPRLYSKEHIENHCQTSVTGILDSVVRPRLNDSYAMPDVFSDVKNITEHLDDVRNRARWIDVDLRGLFASKRLKRQAVEIIIEHMRLVRMSKCGLIPRPDNIIDIVKRDVKEPDCQVHHVHSALIELGIIPDRY